MPNVRPISEKNMESARMHSGRHIDIACNIQNGKPS